jgi:hypothetical protein
MTETVDDSMEVFTGGKTNGSSRMYVESLVTRGNAKGNKYMPTFYSC